MTSKQYKSIWLTGREHHAKKMLNTIRYFEDREFEILTIVGNNVVNFDNYESPLIAENLPYRTIYEYLTPDVMKRIRRHSAEVMKQTDEAIFSENKIHDFLNEFYIRFSIRDVIEIVELFTEIIRQEQPDVVFILHETNFWTKPLAYVANRMNCTVISFQEGDYTHAYGVKRQFLGVKLLADYSHKLCLWGPKDVAGLAWHGLPKERLLAVGPSHLDHYFKNEDITALKEEQKTALKIPLNKPVIMFALPHSKSAVGEFEALVSESIKAFEANPDLHLILKFHPFNGADFDQLKQQYNAVENVQWDIGSNIHHLILATDLCLIQQSTTGSEALALNTPLLEVTLDNEIMPAGYHAKGVAGKACRETLMPTIRKALETNGGLVDPERVKQYLKDTFFKLDGKACERIYHATIKTIDDVVKSKG